MIEVTKSLDPIIPELGGSHLNAGGLIQQLHLQWTAYSGCSCMISIYCTFYCHCVDQSLGLRGTTGLIKLGVMLLM